MKKNLQNEIAIMSAINSPYVVALYNASSTPHNFYLQMELCNGGDLENFLKLRGGFFTENEAKIIIR